MKDNKFNKGDIVICVTKEFGKSKKKSNFAWEVGDILEINSIGYDRYHVKSNDDWINPRTWYNIIKSQEDCFIIATKWQIKYYKIMKAQIEKYKKEIKEDYLKNIFNGELAR